MSQHRNVKAKEKVKTDQKTDQKSETGGKLSPAEAEAMMSSDLPSGDPELSPPAEAADKSPDFSREKLDKAA
jgi:hypothetical protein